MIEKQRPKKAWRILKLVFVSLPYLSFICAAFTWWLGNPRKAELERISKSAGVAKESFVKFLESRNLDEKIEDIQYSLDRLSANQIPDYLMKKGPRYVEAFVDYNIAYSMQVFGVSSIQSSTAYRVFLKEFTESSKNIGASDSLKRMIARADSEVRAYNDSVTIRCDFDSFGLAPPIEPRALEEMDTTNLMAMEIESVSKSTYFQKIHLYEIPLKINNQLSRINIVLHDEAMNWIADNEMATRRNNNWVAFWALLGFFLQLVEKTSKEWKKNQQSVP